MRMHPLLALSVLAPSIATLSWGCQKPAAEDTSDSEGDQSTEEDPSTVDQDGDGSTADQDCDDEDPAVFPDASEECNGKDDDCDGSVDEDVGHTGWSDADGDNWGTGDPIVSCERDPELATRDGDCDDTDPDINPGERETCDGVDQDCDGRVDLEDSFSDEDGDGARGTPVEVDVCDPPAGLGSDQGDCDDGDATVFPGAFESCEDWVDSDCDGRISCMSFALEADDGRTCTVAWAQVFAHTWSSEFGPAVSPLVELDWSDPVYAEAEPDCGWPDGFTDLEFSDGLLGWPTALGGEESWDETGYRAYWVEDTTLDAVPAVVTATLGLATAEVTTSDEDED
jgi:hypothetical protein